MKVSCLSETLAVMSPVTEITTKWPPRLDMEKLGQLNKRCPMRVLRAASTVGDAELLLDMDTILQRRLYIWLSLLVSPLQKLYVSEARG